MFCECSSLSDIKPLENWNVSNGNIFDNMFKECSSLLDITPFKNWKGFTEMFDENKYHKKIIEFKA